MCASVTILVPISWLTATLCECLRLLHPLFKVGGCIVLTVRLHSFQVFGYFVTVLALCISHLRVHLDLWSTPIYEVAWFDDGGKKYSSAPQLPPLDTDTSPMNLTIMPSFLYYHNNNTIDLENQQSRAEPGPQPGPVRGTPLPSNKNVWWDRIIAGRAGRDHPFTFRRPGERPTNYPIHRSLSLRRASASSSSTRRTDWDGPRASAAMLPYSQPQYGRVWKQPSQPLPQLNEEEESFDVPPRRTNDPSAMVDVVLNENEPIPVGDRSQWVRAAQAPGPYPPQPARRARRSQYG